MNFCERLSDLSFRCVQPIQQHGRRLPSFNSEHTRSICCFLTSGVLTEMAQQIHSLRASGVISSHCARAAESVRRAFRKSTGTLCAVPFEIPLLIILVFYFFVFFYPIAGVMNRLLAIMTLIPCFVIFFLR